MELKSRFDFFRRRNLTYLDSAATTQVPDMVIRALDQALHYRGNPSRSAHEVALRNEELIAEARENIGKFIGAKGNEIVFSNNATGAINLAVDSMAHLVKANDEIILSISEHHSNMLPYLKLVKKGAKIRLVGIKNGLIDIEEIKKTLNKRTKIVAINHCSNVLGNINDVETIGQIAKNFNKDILYFIDGTQAVAHIPVDVKKIQSDFYAFSGHKMYGPDGVGVLYVSNSIHHLLTPTKVGGGTVKDVAVTFGKDKDIISPEYHQSLITLEGGTPNTSNIIGLSKTVNFMRSISLDEIRKHEIELVAYLINGLKKFEEIIIFGPDDLDRKIGVISFGIKEYSVKELGDYLAKQKICIRYGSHCAFPLAQHLGQESLRISFGVYSDIEDVDHILGEIKMFFDKKKGLIKNPNLENLRNNIYYKKTLIVNSAKAITEKIESAIHNPKETEVFVMGGHFLAIPDMIENKFWPSIKPLLPERLHSLLEEFGMTSFPVYTWELACQTVAALKTKGVSAKLAIIANDTTGINELRLSPANKSGRSAENYRNELLAQFSGQKGIPEQYLEIAKQYNLSEGDILKNGPDYYFRETILRANFKKFISANNKYFEGVINYSAEKDENIDLSINILDNQQIKSCNFQTFNSKTGGKFCIAELTEFLAELFGKSPSVSFKYLAKKVIAPKTNLKHKMFVGFTPAMCDNAVTKSGELYVKLFLQESSEGSFKFFNIPLGPNAERNLAIGAEMKYVSDKDSLEVLDVPTEPDFAELWKLTEYKLLYDSQAYAEEMEKLFEKIGINKKSNILDTCVGPGFFSTELLQKGYNLQTADMSEKTIKPFQESLREAGIKHKVTKSSWLDLTRHFGNESFDMLLNRGNTIIYAGGGWNEDKKINASQSLNALEKTLKVYFDLLKQGGYLYVDKFRDSEIPDKKVAARLNIKSTGEQKDLVFYVERKPEDNVRFAQLLLRDKSGKENGLPNVAYDLSEEEMENLLKKVGFSEIKKLKLKEERHFVVWLAKK
ncbi:MAG: aminotransferase class V-fold PLP-dependent enzyme [Parcubacteria group bacterium]|jgi:selenocysteine lyase/cysteine desulfurase